ncbi:MAG: restriction endonuclease subunit S [Paludibacter sp.]|nr:restriction endonuclease subunit S [Paludibacter sp.]
MSEWKEYKLKEVVSFIDYRGKTPNKKTFGVPLITAKIVKNGVIQEPTEFISFEDYKGWMTRGFPQVGDVVMTTEAPLGEVAQIKDASFALAQRIITMRGKEGLLNSGYLKYFLQSNIGQARLKERETGTTVTGIKSSELKEVLVSAPNYKVQTAIAEILSSLDDKIELNNQINKDLEALAQALFKQWFIDFEFPNENGEPYRSSGGEMVDSEFGEIPKGWNTGSLSEIIEISHGYAYKGEFFSDIETSEILVTPGNFKIGGGFNLNKFKFYNGICPANYILEKGDLIVTMTDLSKEGDTLGYPALVPNINDKRLHHNQRIGKILFKQTPDYKFYLYWLMRSISYRSFVLSGASGTTVKHTSPSRICEYKTIIPELNTLKAFNDMFSGFFDVEQNNISETSFLVNLRDTLLPKLISGELKVTNNSIEV